MNDKCEWREELIDGSPDKYVKIGLVFYPCDNFDPISWGNGKTVGCQNCVTDIRKPDPKQPTHEEIMTRWWKCEPDDSVSAHIGTTWIKVIQYVPDCVNPYCTMGERKYRQVEKDWFTDRQSADIPPEDK